LSLPIAVLIWFGGPHALTTAFVLCTIAVLTDFADGMAARLHNTKSALGAQLDPLADKVLVIAALAALAAGGHLGPLGLAAFAVTLGREIAAGVLRLARLRTGATLRTSMLAKLKTGLQFAAVLALIAAAAFAWAGVLAPWGARALAVSALLGLVTIRNYLRP
jgi:CDP-diacylglycerol--glycerol-3-phosphate 3-phosphatidyltransferase/cardiolipin synthase